MTLFPVVLPMATFSIPVTLLPALVPIITLLPELVLMPPSLLVANVPTPASRPIEISSLTPPAKAPAPMAIPLLDVAFTVLVVVVVVNPAAVTVECYLLSGHPKPLQN